MGLNQSGNNPEVWGGIECTINRVSDIFLDQLAFNNYYLQPQHEAIATLGIKKLRFPILWEKHQPQKDAVIDWSWTAKQLNFFKENNIEVIAGLVHHGSGPVYTDLLNPGFPELLSKYARQVAEQFPWLTYYTPVNEPLTTARFSGLYGIWYPHACDDKSFLKALLHQVKAIVLSMQEIRKINPKAQLIQTEDLGKTYSTPLLNYQARFENERRWLTYDLLLGKVTEKHKLWNYFIKNGITSEELNFFQENICEPYLLGFNYYVTSERYIDERLHLYPPHTHGSNKKHRYADVEAVRVELQEPIGLDVLLNEAWERYERPLAITEAHLHCHREEQLRWFSYVWNTCNNSKAKGIDLRAVTAWALLGSKGWDKLLTKLDGTYEPGVFDMRSGQLRPTALTHYIKKITSALDSEHPLVQVEGWWQRHNRYLHEPVLFCPNSHQERVEQTAPILIIGKRGTLGKAFAKVCHHRALHYKLLSREDCDISDMNAISQAIALYKPWAIINAAGYVRVDDAEAEEEACMRDNLIGPLQLAKVCQEMGIKLITYSSDLVFDGLKNTPYIESDVVNPLNVYGKSKALSENRVLSANADALIIRTSAFFGPWDQYNFNHWVETQVSNFQTVTVANDIHISPTYVPDLVHATLDLLIDGESGIWHLANKGVITWAELAFEVAERCQLDTNYINAVPSNDIAYPAPRPKYSVLGTVKGQLLPSLENALDRYFTEKKQAVAL
ncbi:MAG TPA: family 1 glycosylhydrolase [Flavisolibacter sp.]|nr:family 1 glycosylhydrolase [Flavisolibacter sp.]